MEESRKHPAKGGPEQDRPAGSASLQGGAQRTSGGKVSRTLPEDVRKSVAEARNEPQVLPDDGIRPRGKAAGSGGGMPQAAGSGGIARYEKKGL